MRFKVFRTTVQDQEQLVEATDKENAIEVAQELDNWDDPIETNDSFCVHEYKENE
jgi:hypothetical protein